jgi:hypothetical protein
MSSRTLLSDHVASSAADRHNNSVKEGIDKDLHHYSSRVQGISDCRARQHKTQRGYGAL